MLHVFAYRNIIIDIVFHSQAMPPKRPRKNTTTSPGDRRYKGAGANAKNKYLGQRSEKGVLIKNKFGQNAFIPPFLKYFLKKFPKDSLVGCFARCVYVCV